MVKTAGQLNGFLQKVTLKLSKKSSQKPVNVCGAYPERTDKLNFAKAIPAVRT
jgi:hypothetical protein